MRGTERAHQIFPLHFKLLLIVTRTGRDYRPGPRQRIEQVARQGSVIPTKLSMLENFEAPRDRPRRNCHVKAW